MTASDRDLNANLVYFLVKNNTNLFTNDKFEAFDENQRSVDLDFVKVNKIFQNFSNRKNL